ncbi:MAG: carbon-nitrogen hydrolase family protein, partial [Cyclobacteriaceae bacterium]
MKMGVAQVRAIRGDIKANLNVHLRWMEKAATSGTELLIFPELSLTGYEPTLASALAIDLHDARLDLIQAFCDQHGMSVGAGAPIRTGPGIGIGMIMFHPHQPRWVYTKKYLHADEEPFFVSGH